MTMTMIKVTIIKFIFTKTYMDGRDGITITPMLKKIMI